MRISHIHAASLVLAAPFLLCASLAAADIRVDPAAAGANNGSSWADARTSLSAALAAASSGDRIWVKAGTYRVAGSRSTSFAVPAGVALYGGFAGTEAALTDRDWNDNPTILSGDIGSNDPAYGSGFTFANTADNAYHVVTGASGARLDGFTVRGGNADVATSILSGGAGTDSSGALGGGILTCTAAELNAWVNAGTTPSGSMTVANCIIENNACESLGGGVAMIRASDNITGCVVRWNRVYAAGDNCTGGGAYAGDQQSVDQCMFIGNTTTLQPGNMTGAQPTGGALRTRGSTRVTNSLFVGNASEFGGAIICSWSSNLATARSTQTIIGCTFNGNSATGQGGSIHISGRCDVTVLNCLFSGGTSVGSGPEININAFGGHTPTVTSRNCTTPDMNDFYSDGVAVVTDSDIDIRTPAYVNTASPLGVDGTPFSVDDGFHLAGGSLDADAGIVPTGANVTHDIQGFTRPNGAAYDRGAYESNTGPTMAAIGDVTTTQATATGAIAITVGDVDGTSGLNVVASSSNTTLIPDASLTLTGSGTSWSLVATPASSQYGTSTITVTVDDGQLTASRTFTVTVNAVNQAPVNVSVPGVSGTNSLASVLTANNGLWTDLETAAASLTFTYQWWRADDTAGTNAAAIGGATASTYTVQAGDASKAIRVVVSATDGGYGAGPQAAAAATTAANSGWLASGNTAATPAITSVLTAAGQVGTAFSYQITASNTPTSYTASGLPAGLSVNTATGVITGTPTTAGTSNVSISAGNVAGSGSATLVMTIAAAPGGTSGSSGGDDGGGLCGAGGAAGLLLASMALMGLRRRRLP